MLCSVLGNLSTSVFEAESSPALNLCCFRSAKTELLYTASDCFRSTPASTHRTSILLSAPPLLCQVIVLEARKRVGGRVHTDKKSFSAPVDLGASIITGIEADVGGERRPDPSALVCKQLNKECVPLGPLCPLYDAVTGQLVPPEVDQALEAEFNALLDDTVSSGALKVGTGLAGFFSEKWV
jgi:hypothetical protein